MKEKLKQKKGITLIALVITIIVLLILAGVSIATLTGQNGILTQAQASKESTVISTEKEQLNIAISEAIMNGYVPSEEIDENYQGLQTELDNVVGIGKTDIVANMQLEEFEIAQVIFVDTGNQYYVKAEINLEDYSLKNMQIMTEEEYFELAKKQCTEDLTELDSTQQAKLENGFKADINSKNGVISISVDSGGIIDWGDGTYSKVKETSYGNLGKVASINSDISLAGLTIKEFPLFHQYNEKNKTYSVKIYAVALSMDNSTSLERITNWGQNRMIQVSFRNCTNLTEIASLGINSFMDDNFFGVFQNCTSLKEIPEDFFENAPGITNVSYAFAGCTSLTGKAINLWDAGNITGTKCYEGCINLTNYEEIPEEWK